MYVYALDAADAVDAAHVNPLNDSLSAPKARGDDNSTPARVYAAVIMRANVITRVNSVVSSACRVQ